MDANLLTQIQGLSEIDLGSEIDFDSEDNCLVDTSSEEMGGTFDDEEEEEGEDVVCDNAAIGNKEEKNDTQMKEIDDIKAVVNPGQSDLLLSDEKKDSPSLSEDSYSDSVGKKRFRSDQYYSDHESGQYSSDYRASKPVIVRGNRKITNQIPGPPPPRKIQQFNQLEAVKNLKFPFKNKTDSATIESAISLIIPIADGMNSLLNGASYFKKESNYRPDQILPLDNFVHLSASVYKCNEDIRENIPSAAFIIDTIVHQMEEISTLKRELNLARDFVKRQSDKLAEVHHQRQHRFNQERGIEDSYNKGYNNNRGGNQRVNRGYNRGYNRGGTNERYHKNSNGETQNLPRALGERLG